MLESIFGHVGSKIGADIKVRALRTIRILPRCSRGPGETGLTNEWRLYFRRRHKFRYK